MKHYETSLQQKKNFILRNIITTALEVDVANAEEIIKTKGIIDGIAEYDKVVNNLIADLELDKKLDFINDVYILNEDVINKIQDYLDKAVKAWGSFKVDNIGTLEDLAEYYAVHYLSLNQLDFYRSIEEAVDAYELGRLIYEKRFIDNIGRINEEYFIIHKD